MKTQHVVRTAAFAMPIFCATLLSSYTPSGVGLTTHSVTKLIVPKIEQKSVVNPSKAIADVEQASATFEQLEYIKQAFSLKISEMSEIFGTSRPTIYAWLNGSLPKDELDLEKISTLEQVAQQFASLSFAKPEAMLKRPVLSGNRTLLQCLKENIDISNEDLKTLHKIDQREAAKRAEVKPAHKRHNDIDSIITPVINDLV